MWRTRTKLILAHVIGFLVVESVLIMLAPSESVRLLDVAFWGLMIVAVMRFESELNDVVISQIDLVAVVSVFLLPPWLAALLVMMLTFSNSIWSNPKFRWTTELMNHLNYGISTGLVGLLFVMVTALIDYQLRSWEALILVFASMLIFYVANVSTVAFSTVAQKNITVKQFFDQNAAGFPIYSLLTSPLAYLCVVLYTDSPLGGWGGWAVIILMLPLFYAQFLITQQSYRVSKINQQIMQSEQSYQDLIEGLPVGLYRVKPDGSFINANTKLAHILGFTDRETLLQHNAIDLYVDPQTRNIITEEISHHDKSVHTLELKRPNGERYWARDTTHAKYDILGNIAYVDGILEDITDQQRIEQELAQTNRLIRQAKQEWEATVDSLPDFVCLLNAQKQIIRSNRIAEAWGLSSVSDITGYPLDTFLQAYKAQESVTRV